MRRLIVFHGKRHRGVLAEAEVSALVTHLAVRSRVGVSGNSSGARSELATGKSLSLAEARRRVLP